MDLYLKDTGDITVSPSGDIAVTQTVWRDEVQQVYVRIMTDAGDWVTYPTLGATLSSLWGKPNSPKTAEEGVTMIKAAIEREGRFNGRNYDVKAIPTGHQTIRFDIYLVSYADEKIKLSVEQRVGI